MAKSHALILSPKFGYIEPDVKISNYKVTFDNDETRPVIDRDLNMQVKIKNDTIEN